MLKRGVRFWYAPQLLDIPVSSSGATKSPPLQVVSGRVHRGHRIRTDPIFMRVGIHNRQTPLDRVSSGSSLIWTIICNSYNDVLEFLKTFLQRS